MTSNGCCAGDRLVNRTKALWEANPGRLSLRRHGSELFQVLRGQGGLGDELLARGRYGGRGIGRGRCPGKRAFDDTEFRVSLKGCCLTKACLKNPSRKSKSRELVSIGRRWGALACIFQ